MDSEAEGREAYESIRDEAVAAHHEPRQDDNFDASGWPTPVLPCVLRFDFGHLISCQLHGYQHVQRQVNHLVRVAGRGW